MPESRYMDRWLRQAAEWLCRLCGLAHRAIGATCTHTLRFGTRWLSRLPWSCHLGLLSVAMGLVSIRFGLFGEAGVVQAAELTEHHIRVLEQTGVLHAFRRFAVLLTAVGIVQLVNAALFAFVRRAFSLWLLKAGVAAFLSLWFYALFFLFRVPGMLYGETAETFSKLMRNQFIYASFVRWLPWLPVALVAALCLALRSVGEFYGGRPRPGRLPIGDRIAADLKTHGKDPGFRTSLYWAFMVHVLVFIVPTLVGRGCSMAPYGVPQGMGQQVVQKIVVKRIKKKKKRKFVLNMNSAILYFVPDLKDSLISQEVDEQTMDTYQASNLQSGMGKGGQGKGGWPNGMANAKVRFIRLEYDGGDWDQDMGKGADYNFLIRFRDLTGFKIARNTEHIRVQDLRRFPAKRKPPFVFMTGRGGVRMTPQDVKTLRRYCLEEGGMVFADNGGGHFNSGFRALMRRVFPKLEWIDIANDDIIFRVPYAFPNGAPPLWHHSGNRAVGLKHGGRWVVFYHQGDVNDAWKTGHSGASPLVAQQAYRLGVNIVNYAFNQYMNIHYGN